MQKNVFRKGLIIGIIILFLGARFVSISSGNYVLTEVDGESGYLYFDEGSGNIAYDSSGWGNHGTIYGASWTSGKIRGEYALDFRGYGYDDYVCLDEHVSDLAFDMDDDCLVSSMFKVRGPHGGMIYHICHSTGSDPGFGISVFPDSVMITIEVDGVYLRATANGDYDDGEWHFVRGRYRGDLSTPRVELYVDFEFYDEDEGYLTPFSSSRFEVCKIGRSAHDDTTHHLNGVLDYVKITNLEQFRPMIPEKPIGRANGIRGVSYTYWTRTEDVNDDDLYWMWDWGDGTYSEWLGPFNTFNYVSASHSWSNGGNYEIAVKAKDEHGAESAWSKPLSITIWPKNRAINTPFLNFLQQYPNLFPILQKILLYLIK